MTVNVRPAAGAPTTTERRVLIVVGLGTLMTSVDTTVTNIALNTIRRYFHSSIADVQWVATGYLLALACVIPVSGWAARRFGTRSVYIAALLIFALASGLCATANALWLLVACRILQGVGAGVLTPLSQVIGAEVAGPGGMRRTVSRIWMLTDLGLVIGPVVGGALISAAGWRWIFLINTPIGLGTAALGIFLLPELPVRKAGPLDVGGLLRLSPGLLLLILAFTEAEQKGTLFAVIPLVLLCAGVTFIVDFVRHALRSRHPLLDVRLFAQRTFSLSSLAIVGFNITWFGVALLVPLYLLQVRNLPASLVGLMLVPHGFGVVLGLGAGGHIADLMRSRRLGLLAFVAFLLTTAVFTQVTPATSYWIVGLTLLMCGFSSGFAWVPTMAGSYAELTPDDISHASPIVSVMMRFGASLGTACAAIILQSNLGTQAVTSSTAHLVGAFHSSFSWTLCAGLVALPAFLALSWTPARTVLRS